MIHLIHRNGMPLHIQYESRQYVMGLRNAILARKIFYQIQPDKVSLLIGVDEPLAINRDLFVDSKATLFIPKSKRCIDAGLDHGLYMTSESQDKFYGIPFRNKNTGIIIPTDLLDETEEDMTLRCLMVVPTIGNEDLKSLFK